MPTILSLNWIFKDGFSPCFIVPVREKPACTLSDKGKGEPCSKLTRRVTDFYFHGWNLLPAVAVVGERSIMRHRVVQAPTYPPTQPVTNPPTRSLTTLRYTILPFALEMKPTRLKG
jgi:hypothetical protein